MLTDPRPMASRLMPDCCHDFCDDGVIYFPYRWHLGVAWYMCREGHTWTCSWGHKSSGHVPGNKRHPDE